MKRFVVLLGLPRRTHLQFDRCTHRRTPIVYRKMQVKWRKK